MQQRSKQSLEVKQIAPQGESKQEIVFQPKDPFTKAMLGCVNLASHMVSFVDSPLVFFQLSKTISNRVKEKYSESDLVVHRKIKLALLNLYTDPKTKLPYSTESGLALPTKPLFEGEVSQQINGICVYSFETIRFPTREEVDAMLESKNGLDAAMKAISAPLQYFFGQETKKLQEKINKSQHSRFVSRAESKDTSPNLESSHPIFAFAPLFIKYFRHYPSRALVFNEYKKIMSKGLSHELIQIKKEDLATPEAKQKTFAKLKSYTERGAKFPIGNLPFKRSAWEDLFNVPGIEAVFAFIGNHCDFASVGDSDQNLFSLLVDSKKLNLMRLFQGFHIDKSILSQALYAVAIQGNLEGVSVLAFACREFPEVLTTAIFHVIGYPYESRKISIHAKEIIHELVKAGANLQFTKKNFSREYSPEQTPYQYVEYCLGAILFGGVHGAKPHPDKDAILKLLDPKKIAEHKKDAVDTKKTGMTKR